MHDSAPNPIDLDTVEVEDDGGQEQEQQQQVIEVIELSDDEIEVIDLVEEDEVEEVVENGVEVIDLDVSDEVEVLGILEVEVGGEEMEWDLYQEMMLLTVDVEVEETPENSTVPQTAGNSAAPAPDGSHFNLAETEAFLNFVTDNDGFSSTADVVELCPVKLVAIINNN